MQEGPLSASVRRACLAKQLVEAERLAAYLGPLMYVRMWEVRACMCVRETPTLCVRLVGVRRVIAVD